MLTPAPMRTRRSYAVDNLLSENTVTYKRSWNKTHHFDAMYGFTFQTRKFENMNASAQGYFVDATEGNDLGAVPSKETIALGSYLEEQVRVSHLSRVNYNYKGKYYFTRHTAGRWRFQLCREQQMGLVPFRCCKMEYYKREIHGAL